MSAPALTARMLGRLPPAWQDGPRLQGLLGALAEELALAERGTLALLRSRHFALAQAWSREDPSQSELGRLGDLMGLRPEEGELPREFRRRLGRFLAIHRDGLGTRDALLRLAALVYRAVDEPRLETDPVSGRRVAMFQVESGRGRREAVRLELEDNPERLEQAALTLGEGERQELEQGGLEPALPEIRLVPEGGDLQFPMVRLGARGETLLYSGTLGEGSELRLRHERPAELDGRVAPAPVFTLGAGEDPAQATPERWRPGTWIHALEHGQHALSWSRAGRTLVDALLLQQDAQALSGDGCFFDDPAARFTERADRGPGARFLGGRNQTQNENVVNGDQARISLELRWVGREPTTFALHIPARYVPPHLLRAADPLNALARALAGALAYGRAAGVRARLIASLALPSDEVVLSDAMRPGAHLRLPEPASPEDRVGMAVSVALGEVLAASDRLSQAGRWDEAVLNFAFFAPPRADAMFGESLFGRARLQDGGVGPFGESRFGAHRFGEVPDGVFGRSRFNGADLGARSLPRLGRMVLEQDRFPPLQGPARLQEAGLDLTTLGDGADIVLDRARLDRAELAQGRPAVLKRDDGGPYRSRPSKLDAVEFPSWPPLALAEDEATAGGRLDQHSLAEAPSAPNPYGLEPIRWRLSAARLDEIIFT